MGTMTEYFDFIKRKKITADDSNRYSHIDIDNKKLREKRRESRKLNKKLDS